MDKVKKVNFEIDADKSFIVSDYNSTTLMKVRMYIVSDGNNAHNMPITKESIELAKSTLVGKPILAHYISYKDDFGGHDPQQVAVGCFISEDDMEVVEEDGKTWLVADGYIWKKYYPEVVDVFIKKDGETSVSMEIEVLETEDRMDGYNETITLWNFSGVTLLGVAPAIKNANAKVLKYSAEDIVIDNIVEKTKEIVFGERIFEVPVEVSENSKYAFDLAKRMNRKTDFMFIQMSELLASGEKLAFEHVEAIYEYLKDKEEFAKKKRTTNDSIFFNGYGGIDGLHWAREIIEEFGINDDIGDKNSDLNINKDIDFQETSENSGIDKSEGHGKETVMADKDTEKDFAEIEIDGCGAEIEVEVKSEAGVEEDMACDEKMQDEEKSEKEEPYMEEDYEKESDESDGDEKFEEKEEEKEESDEDMEEKEEDFEGANKAEEMQKMYSKIEELEKEKEVFESKIKEYEEQVLKLSSEVEDLREYKAENEKEVFESKVEAILLSAEKILSDEAKKTLQKDVANYSFETVELFENKVKAAMCDVLMSQEKEYKFERLPLDEVARNKTGDNDIWGKIDAKKSK